MKKLFFALMAVAAIAMTVCIGCEKKPINEPDAPENGRDRPILGTDSNGTNEPNAVPLRLVQDNQ